MIASTGHFLEAIERIKDFLDQTLTGGLDWRFVNDGAIYEERKISDPAFDKKARIKGGEASSSGLDLEIFFKDAVHKTIRIKCYISPLPNGKYHVNYNYPTGISNIIECLQFLTVNDVYFLIVRIQGPSVLFWLDRYDTYPADAWLPNVRHKREDRMELKREYAKKHFYLIQQFNQTIKEKLL